MVCTEQCVFSPSSSSYHCCLRKIFSGRPYLPGVGFKTLDQWRISEGWVVCHEIISRNRDEIVCTSCAVFPSKVGIFNRNVSSKYFIKSWKTVSCEYVQPFELKNVLCKYWLTRHQYFSTALFINRAEIIFTVTHFYVPRYQVLSLCRGFATTELVSLG